MNRAEPRQESMGFPRALPEARALRHWLTRVRDRALSDVLRRERFEIVFQPVIDLRDGVVAGVEALARFPATSHELPSAWFSRARAAGVLQELELRTAGAALRRASALPPSVYLAVNLSAETTVDRRLKTLWAARGHQIVIEITEHDVVSDYPALSIAAGGLRAVGMRIAVDDAGAGWASLRHILELRPEIVKLDGSLTARVVDDDASRALVLALVGFGRAVGATIVAESVESREQARELRRLGVTHGQGYGLCRPGRLEDVLAAAPPV